MKTIGILYICTGEYLVFWKDFFDSAEKYFLKDFEVHYFVFTDAKEIYQDQNERVHVVRIEAQPWPLPTLLKYHTFLKVEDKISQFDYLYQANANVICMDTVRSEDFLPRIEKGERLMFSTQPGVYLDKKWQWPYDRNKKSLAYIPYNKGKNYVYGAMNGGVAKDFIAFMKELDYRILEDLKHGVIAEWHDESHVNNYVLKNSNYRILPPSYCYPLGREIPYKPIIATVNKSEKIDVVTLKGIDEWKSDQSFLWKLKALLKSIAETKIYPRLGYIRDTVLFRKER